MKLNINKSWHLYLLVILVLPFVTSAKFRHTTKIFQYLIYEIFIRNTYCCNQQKYPIRRR